MKKQKKQKRQNRMDHGLRKIEEERKEMLLTAVSQKRKNEVNRLARKKERLLKKLFEDGLIHILIPQPLS